ncbi:MAG TPA: AAA family ATPase [Solirubrobacterales bacterium]|nr:AAA family ATPase [Solirubrobacterales bacterium]
MHLKRLDLVGFKSFANRTTFLFEPGISVMCGPNGSGKSNVADAVRWALGEQSARAIRGRRGEDVIFVGSQGRQPLGLAEVSLTLDNSEGRIPLDYQEVRVTRRLYRSGEAEYLVNGSKVRLKDIHEWLLHAALDAESYVVVGQGSVDQLILQRPEERRVVIDNAADIRRHQTRLHETRNRLASTEENLLRCRAVIAELEPHVTRLRAQAERAERAQVLRAELGTLAGRWLRHALAGARAELARARAEAAAARAQAERQEAELGDLEALARAADRAATAAEATVAEIEPRLAAARDEVARIGRDLARAEERLAGADESEARLLAEVERQREREAALTAEHAALQQQLAAARAAVTDAEHAAQAAAEAGRAEEEEARRVEGELAAARRRLAALDGELRSAASAAEEARGRIERLERRQVRLAEDLERLIRDLERARTEAAARAAAALSAASALTDARRAREALLERREEGRQRVDRLRAEQHRLSGDRQRLEIARQAAEESGGSQKGSGRDVLLKSDAVAARGLLGGELTVPERYRAAIGAALGERAQIVVLAECSGPDAAVHLIRQRDLDRTGLVESPTPQPAARREYRLRRHYPPCAGEGGKISPSFAHAVGVGGPMGGVGVGDTLRSLLDGLEILGFADELVEAPPELESLVQRVLGSTVVVATLDLAREAASRLASAPAGWQVATLDGVLLRWTGEWWAGRDRQAERLVRRRAELAEIDGRMASVAARLQEIEQQLAEADAGLRQLAADERSVRDALAAAESADRKAALEAQAAAAQASRLERELRDAQAAGPTLETDLQRARAQRERADTHLEETDRRRFAGLEALREAEGRQVGLSERLAEGRAARANLQADLARRRAEIQGVEALLSRLGADLESALRAVTESERRAESERGRRGDLEGVSEGLRGTLQRAESAVPPLVESLAAAREARQQARAKREAIEQRASELRAVARSGRTVLEATAIAESRAADRLERVRREAQEYVDDLAGADGEVQLRLDLGDEPTAEDQTVDDEPGPPFDPEAARRRMGVLRRELRAIGDVGEATLAEFRELSERHRFLVEQVADLELAGGELLRVMEELTGLMREAFDTAFANVNAAFGEYFARLFAGGHAELVLSRPEEVLESGVDIVARPPGKRLQPLVSLSGGERALTMVALIFALLKTNPAPFCVLDEVDAALDESNVRRFTSVLAELSDRTQFVVVSHNRATMESAQALYGISMDTMGVSTVVSLKLPNESVTNGSKNGAAVARNGMIST